jgi:hypothetical protein
LKSQNVYKFIAEKKGVFDRIEEFISKSIYDMTPSEFS